MNHDKLHIGVESVISNRAIFVDVEVRLGAAGSLLYLALVFYGPQYGTARNTS